jgi:hypothetical protein
MKPLLSVLAFLALTACGGGIGVNMDTARDLAARNGEVVPRVETKTAIRAFDKYCAQHAGNVGRTVAALKQDGYKLLITSERDRMFGYVHPSRPFVSVIDDRIQPGCMVMVQRDRNVGSAFDRFVNAKHRDAFDAGFSPGLDRTWIVTGGSRDRIYSRSLDGTEEVLLLFIR